jgi:hypothetical protein
MEEPHQDAITNGEKGETKTKNKNCQDDREAITGKKNKKNNNTHGGPLSYSLFSLRLSCFIFFFFSGFKIF